MRDKQHLDNSLFFSNTAEYVSTILAYAPEAGVYQLNVFGKKRESKESEYLATDRSVREHRFMCQPSESHIF